MIQLISVLLLLTSSAQSPPCGNCWDYVVLGDHASWSAAPYYADFIEVDLGVEVTLHNHTHPAMRSESLLFHLRHSESLRQAIRDAEIVTLGGLSMDLMRAIELVFYLESDRCGGADNRDCFREAVAAYRSNFDAIVTEVMTLRGERDTLVRLISVYYPIGDRPESPRGHFRGRLPPLREVKPFVDALDRYTREAAACHGLPVARTYQALNGPRGRTGSSGRGLHLLGRASPE